ncbi:MAG: hypothetical protein JXR45_18405 [Deltaproteobacteria bacterium]|nr:hypothetical protein [Deltaproteobacteria bacterium]
MNRSQNVYEALELQLAASLKRANFQSVILAEDQGFPVAGVGEMREGEEVAALAPSLVPGKSIWQGKVLLDSGAEQTVTIAPLKTEAGNLYLCGIGGKPTQIIDELLYSCQGVNRILV